MKSDSSDSASSCEILFSASFWKCGGSFAGRFLRAGTRSALLLFLLDAILRNQMRHETRHHLRVSFIPHKGQLHLPTSAVTA